MKETNSRVVVNGSQQFTEISYKNEAQLEKFAIQNKEHLFGGDVIYFDKKTKITSAAKISKVPDGLLLSVPNHRQAKFWLVEYELAKHDIERHTEPQILGFMKAFQNDKSKKIIRDILYDEIISDKKLKKKIRSIIPKQR